MFAGEFMKPLLDMIERPAGIGQAPCPFGPPQAPAGDAPDTPPAPPGARREFHFAPRTLVFLEGDEARSLFQLVTGVVMLYKLLPDGRRQIVEILSDGDVFGCSPTPMRDCSAETLRAAHCVALDRALVERSPMLVRWLNARLRLQLCALHEHVMLLGRKSAMERMTSFLMRCIPSRGRHGCPGPRAGDDRADIRLTMMRQEIADYLGLTIETVSRSLTKLKRRGIVSIGKLDEICVHDVCRLCRLTGTHLTRNGWCSSRLQVPGRTAGAPSSQDSFHENDGLPVQVRQ
jgi:CRP/FNR family transcriptional regulator, anaerobic regulatory protein